MALLFDLESLMQSGGVDAIQHRQRDFSPYLIHFTSWKAMEPVRDYLDALKTRSADESDLLTCLMTADEASKERLLKILSSGSIEPRYFNRRDYEAAVCLTECTLAGVLSHSERYGRYGLVFPKRTVYECGGRPVGYIDSEVRTQIARRLESDAELREYRLFLNNFNRSSGDERRFQDYTHEREWRCPVKLPVQQAEALIVAKTEDYLDVQPYLDGRPFLPLDFLYRLGV